MKATIYTFISILVVCSIAYLVWDGKRKTVVSSSFQQDDDYLYNFLRKDLMSYMPKIGLTYAGWNDDEVMNNYNAGAPSKSEAFIQMAIKHYPAKAEYYNTLLTNLYNKYQ